MILKLDTKRSILQKGVHRITLDFNKPRTYINSDGETISDNHNGIDVISDGTGYDYILAFESGTVVFAKHIKEKGCVVKINHGNGVYTRYMHMKKGSVMVKTGQKVTRGQVIGYMGASGNVVARHLHFDISIRGVYVDPKLYLTLVESLPCDNQPGQYIITDDVSVRKSSDATNVNRVRFDKFKTKDQEQVLKITGREVDYFPTGMIVDIDKISGIWGRCSSGWISLNYCKERG